MESEVSQTIESEVSQTIESEVSQTIESEVSQTIESEVSQTIESEVSQTMDLLLNRLASHTIDLLLSGLFESIDSDRRRALSLYPTLKKLPVDVSQTSEFPRTITFEYRTPLAVVVSPPTIVGEEECCGDVANLTAASAFILPAPDVTNPSVGTSVLVSCRTAFVLRGPSPDFCSSNNATAPLTTPAAMLVPDN